MIVRGGKGVEVALLLDSATSPVGRSLTMAYADFDERVRLRRPSSALVPRSELLASGATRMLDAIRSTPSWSKPAIRFGDTVCVFVDGRPRPGISLNAIDPASVELVEIYAGGSDASNTLMRRWSGPCGDTGMPRIPRGRMEKTTDIVRYVSIWLKH